MSPMNDKPVPKRGVPPHMANMPPPSLLDKLACLKREMALRLNVYPRFVQTGRMKQEQADRELFVFHHIIQDYQVQMDRETDERPTPDEVQPSEGKQ